jgi:predicted ester cyclase
MRRLALLPATVVLSALTAASLLAAFVALRPPAPAAIGVTVADANRDTVLRFYEAINVALSTDDTSRLSSFLARDYSERDASGTAIPGRATLDIAIRGLRLAAPGLRLEVESLVAEDDRVVALVRATVLDSASFLGLDLAAPAVWSAVDVYRVEDGRIVERLGVGVRPLLFDAIASAPLEFAATSEQIVTLQRTTLPQATSHRADPMNGPRVLLVEVGKVSISIEATNSVDAEHVANGQQSLSAGEWLVLPREATFEARNAGEDSALLLEVLIAAPLTFSSFGGSSTAEPAIAGASTVVLAGGAPAGVTPRSVCSIGRLTVAPGSTLAWSAPGGPALLVVEAGTLGLVLPDGGTAWVRRGSDGRASAQDQAALAAGDGALLARGAAVEVRNSGGESVLLTVVTLTDGDGSA